MGLFGFGKKKEEEITNTCCAEATEGICCIKVLGAGCKSCHEQYENVKEAWNLSVESGKPTSVLLEIKYW